MRPPHGNELVHRVVDAERSEQISADVRDAPVVRLGHDLLYDFSNIAQGVYSPLMGFMNRADFLKVVNDLTLENGVAWPLPIVLDVDVDTAGDLDPGTRAGVAGPDGELVGVIDVEEIYRYNTDETCRKLFGTTDDDHPGVKLVSEKDPFLLGGPIKAFADSLPFDGTHDLSPRETRVLFKHRGWDTVVGFQTRNVPHRAHEYLQKAALEHLDGLLVHPKIGKKKPGDYTNEAILRSYDALLENYYPANSVVLSLFRSRMWYAGPREAVFDSIVRKNFGCTHFVIGRDHAGVGDYYGDFEAQELLERMETVHIDPLYYSYAFYCTVCDGIVSEKICPHAPEDRMEPSGTKLRAMLSEGRTPPPELMRPEVAETILALDGKFVEE